MHKLPPLLVRTRPPSTTPLAWSSVSAHWREGYHALAIQQGSGLVHPSSNARPGAQQASMVGHAPQDCAHTLMLVESLHVWVG